MQSTVGPGWTGQVRSGAVQGMAWHGMRHVACGMWHGIAWHGMAWHGMAWHGMARHGMAWHGMAWHGEVGLSLAGLGLAWLRCLVAGWTGHVWSSLDWTGLG